MSRRRRGLAALGVVALAVAGAYLGTAAVVYDQVSRVAADCGGRFAGYDPGAWSAEGVSGDWAVPSFDPGPWLVPAWQEVRFPSRDPGIELHGQWLPSDDPDRDPLVVIVHGRGACVRDPSVLLMAGMLWHADLSALLVDLRDHGSSTIEDGRYAGGTEEYRDVLGAVDWASEQGHGRGGIGVAGVSMGAVTALIAAAADTRIGAAWEDSGYADVVTRIAEELDQKGLPSIVAAAGPLMARLLAGDDLDAWVPLAAVARMGDRPLAIVHGLDDAATRVSHAAALAAAAWQAGVPAQTWTVPGMGHAQAMFADPAAYAERFVRFFRDAFSDPR